MFALMFKLSFQTVYSRENSRDLVDKMAASSAESNATCELIRQLADSILRRNDDEPAISTSGHESAKYLLTEVINPVLCVVGIIGNSMNVIVMTRRRVRSALNSRMERAARVGLLSLTIADILCCVASLVVALGAEERTLFRSRDATSGHVTTCCGC